MPVIDRTRLDEISTQIKILIENKLDDTQVITKLLPGLNQKDLKILAARAIKHICSGLRRLTQLETEREATKWVEEEMTRRSKEIQSRLQNSLKKITTPVERMLTIVISFGVKPYHGLLSRLKTT